MADSPPRGVENGVTRHTPHDEDWESMARLRERLGLPHRAAERAERVARAARAARGAEGLGDDTTVTRS